MVTLALTAILVSFIYTGYGYIQKLLMKFNEQSYFITQINTLNKRFSHLSNLQREVIKENDTKFLITADSFNYIIEFKEKYLLIINPNLTDTFHLEPENLKVDYEIMNNPEWKGKLVKSIEFDVVYEKEKFHLIFNKEYDSYSKLILETLNNN